MINVKVQTFYYYMRFDTGDKYQTNYYHSIAVHGRMKMIVLSLFRNF